MSREQLEIDFLQLINDYRNIIYKVCSAYCANDYDMDDLYQDIVLNLWKSYPRFRGESKVSTWIYRISLNTAISNLRKKKNELSSLEITADLENIIKAGESQISQIKEMYSLIRRLDRYDRALILLWLEDKSYQEIADLLGIAKGNVATKISRVKKKLQKMSNP